jgi:hypothetical protein
LKFFDKITLMSGPMPPDVDSEGDEGDFGPPDPHDIDDFEGDGGGARGPSGAMPTDPLERFIQKLQDLSTMNGPDISAVLDDLPVPQRGGVAGISMQEAVAVCCLILYQPSISYVI